MIESTATGLKNTPMLHGPISVHVRPCAIRPQPIGSAIFSTFAPGISLNYPVGRKMGGGSSVNGAFAVRGIPDDYGRWAAADQ